MRPLRSSLLAFAAASSAVLAFEAGRRFVQSRRRAAENYPFTRDAMLADLAGRLGYGVDEQLPWSDMETVRAEFAGVSEFNFVILQETLRRVDGAIAWHSRGLDPVAFRGFLREIRVYPFEKLPKPVVDTVVVDVGASSDDILTDDRQGTLLDGGVAPEKVDEPEDEPLDVLQGDVAGLGGGLTRSSAIGTGLGLHPEFSIGDRTADGETPRRDPQGRGGGVQGAA